MYLKNDKPVPRNPEDSLMPCRPNVTLSNLETKDNETPLLLTLSIVCGAIRNLRQKRHCSISVNVRCYFFDFVVDIVQISIGVVVYSHKYQFF